MFDKKLGKINSIEAMTLHLRIFATLLKSQGNESQCGPSPQHPRTNTFDVVRHILIVYA
jgi:hypothetical protein